MTSLDPKQVIHPEGRSGFARARVRPRPRRRPILLLLVMCAFLVIVGLTATGQAFIVTADSSASLINGLVGSDAATIRSFVTLNLEPDDLNSAGLTPERARFFNKGLSLLTEQGSILQVALLLPDGTALAISEPGQAGSRAVRTRGFEAALSDRTVQAEMVPSADSGSLTELPVAGVIAEYFPIISEGRVYAVIGLWRDAGPLVAQLEESRVHVIAVVLAAALVSLILLYFVFRATQQRLSRQTDELLEATRRDALTGSLNHGALVSAVTERIEATRSSGHAAVSVALLDVDNLSLLNNTYGHAAGDNALLMLAKIIAEHLPAEGAWGRYGPDEFLILASGSSGARLEAAVESIRTALLDLSLSFETSERLPVTISAGIASYPVDAHSVTSLLATASVTLDEAKASGGDAVRLADPMRLDDADAGRFDILEGLILAVDAKDRYTRRHSEDVARYAAFLADRLGLDADFRRSLYRAGRLHDVGKIGIPDGILRKPGRLTEEEYAIVKQHVALGDLIVRDLPDVELVRAGVRHHHERWDGQGYLHGLAGEEIPLIARILAVGDAFSAMTTTRPYRKALPVEEALSRLEDASATQLDERLVLAFVEGIRTADDPPLPGDLASSSIWTPYRMPA
jgi:diguanylate cyclase (GGDEF)-like protein